jgi:predicted signal transduction protein with EAL and GGDEF domain
LPRSRNFLKPPISARASSTSLARLGGDEFTILLADEDTTARSHRIAEHIIAALRNPIAVGDRWLFVSASIGMAIYDRSLLDGEADLLRAADLALYSAKSRGKSQTVAFEPSMATDAVRRMELQSNLRTAIDRNELMLHFQPLIALATGKVAEVEALVHWQHPLRGQSHRLSSFR